MLLLRLLLLLLLLMQSSTLAAAGTAAAASDAAAPSACSAATRTSCQAQQLLCWLRRVLCLPATQPPRLSIYCNNLGLSLTNTTTATSLPAVMQVIQGTQVYADQPTPPTSHPTAPEILPPAHLTAHLTASKDGPKPQLTFTTPPEAPAAASCASRLDSSASLRAKAASRAARFPSPPPPFSAGAEGV